MRKPDEFTGVLVTGAQGRLGSALVGWLQRNLPELPIIALDRSVDLTSATATNTAFEHAASKAPISHLFHLAVRAPSGAWIASHPADAWHINTLINANVFGARQRHISKCKLVSALSYSIFEPSGALSSEGSRLETNPLAPLAAHNNTKQGILAAQTAFDTQHGTRSISIVLPTVYGGTARDRPTAQVIETLIGRFLSAKAQSEPAVTVWGSGTQVRDFLHIDDAISGLIAAARFQEEPMINIGSGTPTSVAECAQLIAQIAQYSGKIQFDATCYSGTAYLALDIAMAAKHLKWQPRIALKDGLAQTIAAAIGATCS